MQLCDKQIHEAIAKGDLLFAGANPKYPFKRDIQVQPASVDLRLGNRIMRYKKNLQSFDINNIKEIRNWLDVEYIEDGYAIEINPNEVLFAQIYEQISIPNYLSARIEGRSRVARLGVSVHCTGDYINPGFAGAMPLQIVNHNSFPVVLYPYISICQMILYKLTDIPLVSYLERSSLPYNTYYNETNPSPSILSGNVHEAPAEDSIVEIRIRQLIENYYNTISKEQESHISAEYPRQPHSPNTELITDATERNLQGLLKGLTIYNNNNIGGINMDQYNAKQAGIQGRNAGDHATIHQHFYEDQISDSDVQQLCVELENIKAYLHTNFSDDEHNILLGDVSNASQELKKNDKSSAMNFIKKGGKLLYDIAKSIGCSLIARYLAKVLFSA